jgi:hypothetical protein
METGSDFSPGERVRDPANSPNQEKETKTKPLEPSPINKSLLAPRRKSDSEVPSVPSSRSLFTRFQDKFHSALGGSDKDSPGLSAETAEAGTSMAAKMSPSPMPENAETSDPDLLGSKGEAGGEESTDSENDPEPSKSFHRKLSTSKDIKNTVSRKIFNSDKL